MVYPHLFRSEHSETKTTNSAYGAYYADSVSRKIAIQPDLLKILQYVDSNRTNFIEELSKLVEIESHWKDLCRRKELTQTLHAVEKWLFKLGIKYEVFNVGFTMRKGKKIKIPPIILGSLGHDPNKTTICIYGHLDVGKPNKDEWQKNPFKLVRENKTLYGSGVASGKGLLLCWFHVIQAFQSANIDIPVNIKFIIESMYYQNSEGLRDFLETRKQDFFYNIDNVFFGESEWIGAKRPCIVYGSPGSVHYTLSSKKVPNSKTEPNDDIEAICGELVDDRGHILFPHYYDYVCQITPEEEKIYEAIVDFNIDAVVPTLPQYMQSWSALKLLMHYWRFPTIWFDNIETCTCEKNEQTIVKRDVILKIVPRQIVDRNKEVTKNYLKVLTDKLGIENKIKWEFVTAVRTWLEDVLSPPYEAARRSIIQIYKEEPQLIREDRPRFVLTVLEQVLEKPIVVLPICVKGSNVNEPNENVTERSLFEGIKTYGAYLFQISQK